MSVEVHNLVQVIPDLFLTFWFFRTAESGRRPGYAQAIGALTSMAATVVLYFTHSSIGFPLRFLYRAVCYTLFLRLWYGTDWQRSAFFALFTCACWTACQNILLTPLLFPVVQNSMELAIHPLAKELFFTLLRAVIMAVPLAAVSCLIPFRNISGPGFSQWGVLTAVILCDMYVKQTLNVIAREAVAHPLESSLFPMFLQLFLMGFLAFFERSLYSARRQQEIYMQSVLNRYRLQNLESKQLGDTDLRQLYHDMKNHLLAIRALAEGAPSQSVDRYIDALLQGMHNYENQVETGNPLLNGLMTQKLAEARQHKVAMDLIIDFRQADFIEDMDLCTLFGNAVDNALEACAEIPENEERQILIRTQESAGQLLITVGNTYQGEIRLADGLPRTSKADADAHGIGLRNIRRVLKKYGGVMDIDLSQPGWFRLTMLLPLAK